MRCHWHRFFFVRTYYIVVLGSGELASLRTLDAVRSGCGLCGRLFHLVVWFAGLQRYGKLKIVNCMQTVDLRLKSGFDFHDEIVLNMTS
jgi:hypothetical protein